MRDGNVALPVRHPTTPGATLVDQLRWQVPEAHAYPTATRDLLALAADEIERLGKALSDTVPAKWRDADHDPPADEQQVLACWKGSSCIEGMETLIYCADQDGSGDGWRDVHGDSRDPPTHWTLLEMPK